MSCILLGDYESFSRLNIPLFLERVSAGFPSGIYPNDVLVMEALGMVTNVVRSLKRGG